MTEIKISEYFMDELDGQIKVLFQAQKPQEVITLLIPICEQLEKECTTNKFYVRGTFFYLGYASDKTQ